MSDTGGIGYLHAHPLSAVRRRTTVLHLRGTGFTSDQTFTVTPGDLAQNTTVASGDEPDTSDDRQYTVNGLDGDVTYKVALFPAENVSVDGNGVVTFEDANDNDRADGAGTTNAFISVVNGGTSGTADGQDGPISVSPVNGTINFTVDYDGTGTTEEIVLGRPAIAQLCRLLTDTKTVYPGTDLTIVYAIKDPADLT